MAETVPLAAITAIAREVGLPTDKTCLVRRLRKEGAAPIRATTLRGQQGFVFVRESLPKVVRERLADASVLTKVSLETYARAPATMKAEADRRVKAMLRLRNLMADGTPAMEAYAAVADEFGESVPTVRRAWKTVRTAVEGDWIALLVKGYKGRQAAALDDRVWGCFVADYGRVEDRVPQRGVARR